MFNLYVYYRVDAQCAARAETAIRAMQAQLASRSGVAPQLLKKRDASLLWMETYQHVADAEALLSERTRISGECGLDGCIEGEPHVECFLTDTFSTDTLASPVRSHLDGEQPAALARCEMMPRGALDELGWLDIASRIASPNCDARPDSAAIRLVVIHNISLPPGIFTGDAVIELFTNRLDWDAHPYYAQLRGMRVSAHFFIRRNGDLLQFVPCRMRAWHAGVSEWRGQSCCNDFSIGIELEGSDASPFADAQYATLAPLIATLKSAYPIEAVTGHADIAPGRKTDPGPFFDWHRVPSA